MRHGLPSPTSSPSSHSSPSSTAWLPLLTTLTHTHPNRTSRHSFPLHHNPSLPFLALSTPLPPAAALTAQALYERYLFLLQAATLLTQPSSSSSSSYPPPAENPTTTTPLSAAAAAAAAAPPLDTVPRPAPTPTITNKHVPISYNLALTTSLITICPRRAEGCAIPGLEGSMVALNGTILGGTLMVKERAEWDALREREGEGEGGIDEVLREVGFPNASAAAADIAIARDERGMGEVGGRL
jgi:hypothetical protein